jgi:DnaK suppressor protein
MQKTLNLQTIKQTLTKQRAILLIRLEEREASKDSEGLLNPDKDDRAMTARNKNKELLLIGHAKQQIQDIDQALKRLETGAYGICLECGENIQPERLEIIPTAALCIKCQRNKDSKRNGRRTID